MSAVPNQPSLDETERPVTVPLRVPDLEVLFQRLKEAEMTPQIAFHLVRIEDLVKAQTKSEEAETPWWVE